MFMMQSPLAYPAVQRGLLALFDEEDPPRGLLGLLGREGDGSVDENPAPYFGSEGVPLRPGAMPENPGGALDRLSAVAGGVAGPIWDFTKKSFEPYTNFYLNSIVRPFYAGFDALAETPLGDPGFYVSVEGAGPPGAMVGGLGSAGASVVRALARGRSAKSSYGAAPLALDNQVLLDSSVVPRLPGAPTLGGRILEGEEPIVSYVTRPEMTNSVLMGRGLKGVPRVLDDLPVLSERPAIDARINIRGQLNPGKPGLFGDGIVGAQAIENRIPLVTDDRELIELIRSLGGVVR